MATYCLTPQLAEKFKKELVSGKINPDELIAMTSAERRAFFTKIIGEDNAKNVNALFESKLLLKNQKKGMVSWAKKVTGISEPVRRDLIAKIERLDKVLTPAEEEAFLEDLVSKRLGTDVTYEEAQKIAELYKKSEELKAKIPEDSPIASTERMEYGKTVVELNDFVNALKLQAESPPKSLVEKLVTPFKHPVETLYSTAGVLKSMVASLDNSFFGRQGIKMLYTNPDIWLKTFLKSWKDIGMELRGKDAILPIKADIMSRPNALNGKYRVGGYGLSVVTEEAFPSSLPEKIPVLGRLFKASESAYNGAALRMRADYADRLIKQAEKAGVDTLDPEQAKGLGKLVSSLTGRGNIGKLEVIGKEINATFFSIKFLKSNFDTLTAHMFDKTVPRFVKRQAATNLLKIIGSIAGILTLAELLHPGSVETDPRSSDFGKIKVGNTRFDITGGMSSLVVLAARVTPTKHEGKWSFWSKSSTSGKYTDLLAGKYGQQNALDIIDQFWQNKLSPLAGVIRDVWKGEMFGGKKPTLKNELLQATTPISIQNFQELMNDPNSANPVASMILDGLGISTNTYSPKKK